MRWDTVVPADQRGTSLARDRPAADPGVTDDERRTIAKMMPKAIPGFPSVRKPVTPPGQCDPRF